LCKDFNGPITFEVRPWEGGEKEIFGMKVCRKTMTQCRQKWTNWIVLLVRASTGAIVIMVKESSQSIHRSHNPLYAKSMEEG
jgi:hypothetical protein